MEFCKYIEVELPEQLVKTSACPVGNTPDICMAHLLNPKHGQLLVQVADYSRSSVIHSTSYFIGQGSNSHWKGTGFEASSTLLSLLSWQDYDLVLYSLYDKFTKSIRMEELCRHSFFDRPRKVVMSPLAGAILVGLKDTLKVCEWSNRRIKALHTLSIPHL